MSSAKPVYTIYGDSCTIVAPSLNIFPVQITQSYVGDCPANIVDCLALQILQTKTYNRRFLPNPTDKYARQCSGAPSTGSKLHCTGSHICQLDLFGIADYIVFIDRICNVCANPPSSKLPPTILSLLIPFYNSPPSLPLSSPPTILPTLILLLQSSLTDQFDLSSFTEDTCYIFNSTCHSFEAQSGSKVKNQ